MALSTYHDPGYTTFLTLLHQPTDVLLTISLPKLTGAIAHYLSTIPLAHVPSFCNALATSRGVWDYHHRDERGDAVGGAVRSAVSARVGDSDGGSRKVRKELGKWVEAVVEGVVAQRPDPAVRLSLLTGLVQGIDDLGQREQWESVRGKVEAQVVVACAELVEVVVPEEVVGSEDWSRQYEEGIKDRPTMASKHLSLALKLAPAMLLLSIDNLVLLDLDIIARISLEQISYTFQGGHFLKSLPPTLSTTSTGHHEIEPTSYIIKNIDTISSYAGFQHLSVLSKLLARCIAGSVSQSSTRVAGWEMMVSTVERLEDIARPLEADWARSGWAKVIDESTITPTTKPTLTALWNVLKSFLFSTILITQSILLAITFHPHPPQLKWKPETHAQSLAASIVSAFLHLSFITSRFGGGLTSHGGGFPEQKRVFYGSLDVLASDEWEVELCLKRVAGKLPGLSLEIGHPVREARTSFFLACAEQLMPKLSESAVEHTVLPVAYQHLSRPDHRETYESAHSVVLSVFANHAKLHSNEESAKGKGKGKGKEAADDEKGKLAETLVPFYVECLLENSGEGKLSTPQLRLAYSSVTRSASSTSPVLAQFCIDKLLTSLSASPPQPDAIRLRLVLVSLISSVDCALLPALLESVREEVVKEKNYERRMELKDAVFKEVERGVGDAEREVAMRWWLDVRDELGGGV